MPPRETVLILPPIREPQRYAGLYVYDFGTHVCVGYTAAEIRILREAESHRDGTAYEIYRVSESGAIELRGVRDERLSEREAVCLLRADGVDARRDYDTLRKAGERHPVACVVELQLAKLYEFDPPHVTALCYPASATSHVANWLLTHAPNAGDRVLCGIDVHAQLAASDGVHIDSCSIATKPDFRDRSAEEVFATIDKALQR